jgi:hypothetical protein
MRGPRLDALIVIGCLCASSVAIAAPAPANKEFVDALNRAQSDYKARRFQEALAEARAADAIIPDPPPAIANAVHHMIVRYAVLAKDFPAAISELQEMIASGEGKNPERQLLDQLQTGHYP